MSQASNGSLSQQAQAKIGREEVGSHSETIISRHLQQGDDGVSSDPTQSYGLGLCLSCIRLSLTDGGESRLWSIRIRDVTIVAGDEPVEWK